MAAHSSSRCSRLSSKSRSGRWRLWKSWAKRIILWDMHTPTMIYPTKDLVSPFLSVNRESRECATKHYGCKVKVKTADWLERCPTVDCLYLRHTGLLYMRPEEHCFTVDVSLNNVRTYGGSPGNLVHPNDIPFPRQATMTPQILKRIKVGLVEYSRKPAR